MAELNKKIIEILEDNEWSIAGEISEYSDGRFCVEIENYSPAGEDIIEAIWFDGTDKGFINGVKRNADDFDPEEHAEMWIESRGKNGVPETIRELIDDADAIKDMLETLATALEIFGMSLAEYLDYFEIDEIMDDDDFMTAEHDAVMNYCLDRDFNVTEDDISIIKSRGLYDAFEEWKTSNRRSE